MDRDDLRPKNLMVLPRTFLMEVTTFLDPGSLCYLRAVNHSFNQIIPHPPAIIENGRKLLNMATMSDDDSWGFPSYFTEELTIPYLYDAENLGTYLQYSTNLHTLDLLQEYQIKDSGKIFPYLTTLTRLRSLTLPSLVWTHDEGFSSWLGKNIYLQALTLERSRQYQLDAKAPVSLRLLTNLQQLAIGGVDSKEIQALTDAFLCLKYLRSLKLPHHKLGKEGGKILCSALTQCPYLEEIDIEARREKYDCISEIAPILSKIKSLKNLKLLIGDEGALALTPVFPRLASLKSLSIRFPINPKNQHFLVALGSCTTLEDLEIFFQMSSSRDSPFPHIKKLTQLKSLVLNYGSVQDVKSDQLLGAMLLNLSKLERLKMDLSSGQLNLNMLAPFFSKLENLQVLSLSGLSSLKENKAVSLAKLLSYLPRLEKLEMKETVSKMTLEKIIPSLQLSPNFKEFHFFCGKDFQPLFLILSQLKTLEELHMHSVDQGTFESLRGLKNALNKPSQALQHSYLKEIYWDGYHLWNYGEEDQILKELGGIFNSLPALERVYFPKHAITPTGRHFLRTTVPSVRLCLYLGFQKGKKLW